MCLPLARAIGNRCPERTARPMKIAHTVNTCTTQQQRWAHQMQRATNRKKVEGVRRTDTSFHCHGALASQPAATDGAPPLTQLNHSLSFTTGLVQLTARESKSTRGAEMHDQPKTPRCHVPPANSQSYHSQRARYSRRRANRRAHAVQKFTTSRRHQDVMCHLAEDGETKCMRTHVAARSRRNATNSQPVIHSFLIRRRGATPAHCLESHALAHHKPLRPQALTSAAA